MASSTITERPSLLDEAPHGLIHAVFVVVIGLQFIYLFTFNWHPDLRLPLSSTLAGVHVAFCALTVVLRPANWHKPLLLFIAVFVLTLIPPHAMGHGEVRGLDYTETIRRLILPMMMIWILTYPLALPVRLLWWVALFGTLYSAYIVYVEPPLYYNPLDSGPRFASITGGIEHIHPSAKFLALHVVLIDLLRRGRLIQPILSWLLIFICIYLMLGLGARTQFLFLVVYGLALAGYRYQELVLVRWLPFLGMIIGVAAAIIALNVGTDVEKWGSGRIGTWSYRLQLIADRDLVHLLFGGGVGSDNIWTPVWGWADDELISHNDYLFFLDDHGIIGLSLPFLFLAALWIRSHEYGRAIIMAVAVSAFFDNGYFRSPLTAAYLAIVFATALLVSILNKERDGSLFDPSKQDYFKSINTNTRTFDDKYNKFRT